MEPTSSPPPNPPPPPPPTPRKKKGKREKEKEIVASLWGLVSKRYSALVIIILKEGEEDCDRCGYWGWGQLVGGVGGGGGREESRVF